MIVSFLFLAPFRKMKRTNFSYLNCQKKRRKRKRKKTRTNPFPISPTTCENVENVRTIKWKFFANYLSASSRWLYYLWRNYTTSNAFSKKLHLFLFLGSIVGDVAGRKSFFLSFTEGVEGEVTLQEVESNLWALSLLKVMHYMRGENHSSFPR